MRLTKISFLAGMMTTLGFLVWFCCGVSQAQSTLPPPSYGPYSGLFRPGGSGLAKPGEPTDAVFQATSPWSLYCWFQVQEPQPVSTLLAGVGNPVEEYSRYFGIRDGKLIFRIGENNALAANIALSAAQWHFVAATFDGASVHLYSDGQEVASGQLAIGRVSPNIQMAPDDLPWKDLLGKDASHFGGKIADLTLLRTTLTEAEIRQLAAQAPNPTLIEFEEGSKPWPLQTRQQAGYRAPQDPSSLPRSAAPFSSPAVRALPPARTTLQPRGENQWTLEGGWKLTPAPENHRGRTVHLASRFRYEGLVAGDRSGHGSKHDGRSRCLSRSRLWPE